MKRLSIALTLLVGLCTVASAEDWKPVEGHIMTQWADEVDPKATVAAYREGMAQRAREKRARAAARARRDTDD